MRKRSTPAPSWVDKHHTRTFTYNANTLNAFANISSHGPAVEVAPQCIQLKLLQ